MWGEAACATSGTRLAVAVLDIDHFKRFNDSKGHPAGDALLREAAQAWRTSLRQVDSLARYGGEEFAVLLPGCPPHDACAVVDRVRARGHPHGADPLRGHR